MVQYKFHSSTKIMGCGVSQYVTFRQILSILTYKTDIFSLIQKCTMARHANTYNMLIINTWGEGRRTV